MGLSQSFSSLLSLIDFHCLRRSLSFPLFSNCLPAECPVFDSYQRGRLVKKGLGVCECVCVCRGVLGVDVCVCEWGEGWGGVGGLPCGGPAEQQALCGSTAHTLTLDPRNAGFHPADCILHLELGRRCRV